jgi:hypothetical protein
MDSYPLASVRPISITTSKAIIKEFFSLGSFSSPVSTSYRIQPRADVMHTLVRPEMASRCPIAHGIHCFCHSVVSEVLTPQKVDQSLQIHGKFVRLRDFDCIHRGHMCDDVFGSCIHCCVIEKVLIKYPFSTGVVFAALYLWCGL